MKKLLLPLGVLMIAACTNYYKYPPFSENGNAFMIVVNPAGTNTIYGYDPVKNRFDVKSENENSNEINYLPYPVNFGFIPSTVKEEALTGAGYPLDVLAIGSTIKQGSLLEFVPVGVLKVSYDGEEDRKIIGVVVNSEIKIIDCKTLACLQQDYPGLTEIIETWYNNHRNDADVKVLGWEDEKTAMETIKRWSNGKTDIRKGKFASQ